jgi:hypothetical protein
MKKDKEKVLDEVWTESRVREFLDSEPKAGSNRDFHALLKAHQSMRAEDFELFIGMFLETGRDLNATNKSGRTALSYAKEHRNSGEHVVALESNGAI